MKIMNLNLQLQLSHGCNYFRDKKRKKNRSANQLRDKSWWNNGCGKNGEEFKRRLPVTGDTFDLLLEHIRAYIEKTPTKFTAKRYNNPNKIFPEIVSP